MCPSLTIRDLLWLTLVVALAVGWWVDHRRYTDPNIVLFKPLTQPGGSSSLQHSD